MAAKQKICARGHDMAQTRKIHPNGDSYCYACKLMRYTAHRKANPDAHKEYCKRSKIRKAYGLEPNEYKALIEQQNGVCAICKSNDNSRNLHVDHCHKTGVVRGLLCHGCNTALGLLKEDEQIIMEALQYLAKAGKSRKREK